MNRGHGTIINLSSFAPFIFTYNPESVESEKKISYTITPNIGGAFKRRYFSGFESKQVSFKLVLIDMESPTGVLEEISYFEQLREPDPGILGLATLYGNENYPPPQILFQFGVSFLPLVWDVLDVKISGDHYYSGSVRGVIGVPKKADIILELALDESNIINKANQIAKKADMYAASAKSLTREVLHNTTGKRKEMPGIFPKNRRIDAIY
jgi:hypothetical protein